jgi:hypothetical protein
LDCQLKWSAKLLTPVQTTPLNKEQEYGSS